MHGGTSQQCSTHCTVSVVLLVWVSRCNVVLWLFYKHESLRTISNRFLASLSIADVFVGLVIDPVWIVIISWIQPEFPNCLILL